MAMAQGSPSRAIRAAGYLIVLFSLFGAFAGILAASTFYYFQGQADYANSATAALTIISAIGAAICVVGVIAGRALLNSRGWAWNWSLASSLAAVTTVGALIAFWPTRWGFFVAAAVAYALVVGLLLWGHSGFDIRTHRPAGA